MSGEIKERLVAFELFIAEDAERGVTDPVSLDDGGGFFAERLSLSLDAIALGNELGVAALRIVEIARALIDRDQVALQGLHLIADVGEGLDQLLLPSERLELVEVCLQRGNPGVVFQRPGREVLIERLGVQILGIIGRGLVDGRSGCGQSVPAAGKT